MAEARRRPVFYLLGDSLTQDAAGSDGWGTLLQQTYLRSVDVINRGLSGYNTKWFLEHAMPVIRSELEHSFAPAFITLWLGANDAALSDGRAQKQRVPVEDYRSNLIAIVTELQRLAPTAKILLIAPPVVGEDQRRRIQVQSGGPSDPLDRTNDEAGRYASACVDAAAAIDGLAVLNMHDFFMRAYPEAADRARFLSDGLHFSKDGNRVVFEQVNKHIKSVLSAALIEEWQLPNWNTLV